MPAVEKVIADLVIGVDHVGFAVQNLATSIEKWEQVFGATLHSREINQDQGVEEAMLRFSDGSQIQLLAALNPESAIGKFLAKRGEGVQQVALQVSNLELATQRLTEAQIPTVYPTSKSGSNKSSINFIHPKYTGGVLIELVENSA